MGKASVKNEDVLIELFADSNAAYVNGEAVLLDAPSFVRNGRMYIPVRFVAESLGAKVEWDGTTSTATIIGAYVDDYVFDEQKYLSPEGHSRYYLEGYNVDQIITYFNEVCLDTESKINMGNTNAIQKWSNTVYYKVYGDYTDEDVKTISDFAKLLNGIHGFPGMYSASADKDVNLPLYYCTYYEMIERLGEGAANADGAGTYWYNSKTNSIIKGIICCQTVLEQDYRNVVTMHEIYNIIGAPNDTKVREDSLIYQYYIEAEEPTDLDILILELLYNPLIKCGMQAEQCEIVIRELYY